MPFLRRHRLRLGRLLVSVLALSWMTLALQPCAAAEEPRDPVAATEHHPIGVGHAAMRGIEHSATAHAGMEAMAHDSAEHTPCATEAYCPVFKAVAGQAATKAADPMDLPLQPAPALFASWPLPALLRERGVVEAHSRVVPLPPSPLLFFRVLLI